MVYNCVFIARTWSDMLYMHKVIAKILDEQNYKVIVKPDYLLHAFVHKNLKMEDIDIYINFITFEALQLNPIIEVKWLVKNSYDQVNQIKESYCLGLIDIENKKITLSTKDDIKIEIFAPKMYEPKVLPED